MGLDFYSDGTVPASDKTQHEAAFPQHRIGTISGFMSDNYARLHTTTP